MKPVIYLFIAIFVISLASAFPAGTQQIIYNFDRCDSLRVDVTGTLHINESEYWFVGCNETENNSWYCDCTDDYNLTLDSDVRAKNNYTFHVEYNYTGVSESFSSSSGGGGGGSSGDSYIVRVNKEKDTYLYVYKGRDKRFILDGKTYRISVEDKDTFRITPGEILIELENKENKTKKIGETYLNTELVRTTNTWNKLSLREVNEPFSPVIAPPAATTTTVPSTTTTTLKPVEDPIDLVDFEENQTKGDTIIPTKTEKDNMLEKVILLLLGSAAVIGLVFYYISKKVNKNEN